MTLRDSVRRLAASLGLGSDADVRTGHRAVLGTVGEDQNPTEILADAGVLEPAGDGYALADEFGTRWLDSMEPFRTATAEQVADGVRGVRPDATVTVEDRDGRPTIVVAGGWDDATLELSRAAAIADVAAVNTLAGSGVEPTDRLACLPVLRRYLEACPDCEEQLVADGDGGPDEAVVGCPNCGAGLAERS